MKPLSNCNFQIGFGTIFHRCYVQLVKENQNIQIQNKLVQPFIFGVQIIDQSFQFSESTQVIAFEEIFVSKKLTYLLVSSCAVHVSTSTWLQEPREGTTDYLKHANENGPLLKSLAPAIFKELVGRPDFPEDRSFQWLLAPIRQSKTEGRECAIG